jgi:hypothetical protein
MVYTLPNIVKEYLKLINSCMFRSVKHRFLVELNYISYVFDMKINFSYQIGSECRTNFMRS